MGAAFISAIVQPNDNRVLGAPVPKVSTSFRSPLAIGQTSIRASYSFDARQRLWRDSPAAANARY
jgi:hypothetical protein